MNAALEEKRQRLRETLGGFERLAVAYSGGVDSGYLAWEAHDVLGQRMEAVLAESPSLPRRELRAATSFAQRHGIPLRVVHTQEMQRTDYVRNDGLRCFHCKDELFRLMETLRESSGLTLAYGRNLDDAADERPGQRAADLHGVRAPLAEAGLDKASVRGLAHAQGLELWDKPASPCLASRIEPGRPVTAEALAQVDDAEDRMLELGFREVRVRHHGALARVELERSELMRALSPEVFAGISAAVRRAGFRWVALDMDGYRSGSTSALLPSDALLSTGKTER